MNFCDKILEIQMWKVEYVYEDEVRKEWDVKQITLCISGEIYNSVFQKKKLIYVVDYFECMEYE